MQLFFILIMLHVVCSAFKPVFILGPPSKPRNLRIIRNKSQANLTWDFPEIYGGRNDLTFRLAKISVRFISIYYEICKKKC